MSFYFYIIFIFLSQQPSLLRSCQASLFENLVGVQPLPQQKGEGAHYVCITASFDNKVFLRIFNCSAKNHIISTYPFLFIIRRFECYYTHCQETTLN